MAAVLLGLACGVVVEAVRPPPPPSTPVVVAAADLPVGTVLTAASVRVVLLPDGLAPRGALGTEAEALDRTTAVAVPRGLPVVDSLLADAVASGPPGTVVVPVRFADDAVAGLLRAGDKVDVLAATGGDSMAATRLAEGATVVEGAPQSEREASLLGTVGSGNARLTLLAVLPAEAERLAGAAGWASLTAVIVG